MKRYINQCDHLGEHMVETPDGDLCLYVEVESERAKDKEEIGEKDRNLKRQDDYIAGLAIKIARLRKALWFYEDKENWKLKEIFWAPGHSMLKREIDNDNGNIARETLVDKEGDREEDERYLGEKCEHCGKRYLTCWLAPDYVWHAVTGHDEEGLLCPNCFDEMARNKGVILAWRVEEELKDGVLPIKILAEKKKS